MQALREWCADSWQRKAIAVLINTAAFLVSVLAAMLAYTLIFKAPSLGEMVGRLWYTIVMLILSHIMLFPSVIYKIRAYYIANPKDMQALIR